MPSYTWKQNDTGYVNTTTLKDRDGNAVNLAGATVKFIMRPVSSDAATIDAAAEVVSAAAGTVRYDRQAADTATSGAFLGEYEVTYSDGSVQTYPEDGYITVRIVDDLG